MQEVKTISAYKQGLKEKILQTAMKAFAEEGIRAVKMDDIACRLGISKRTLYEIYATKEDLLYEGVRRFREQSNSEFERIGRESSNVMEILLKVYRMKVDEFQMTKPAFYVDMIKYPHVHRFLNRENQRARKDMLRFFERGVAEGYFRDDVNYELVGRLFDALGRYIMAQQLFKQYGIEDLLNNLVVVSLRGCCTEKGIRALEKLY